MNSVLQALRGQQVNLREFNDAFALAEQEGVLPVFVAHLRASAQPLPADVMVRCTAAEREAAVSSFWWTSELRNVLRGFAHAGVQVILLKGPSLAERLYGAATLRGCRDLDLLVRRRDAVAAGAVLAGLGFTPAPRPDDYHRGWTRSTTMVELHLDVENPLAFDFAIDAAWERARPIQFAGEPAWVLGPADELLYLCLHGVRHLYQRLSYVMDVLLACRFLAPNIDATAYTAGTPRRLQGLLVLGHAMARKIDTEAVLPPTVAPDARTTMHLQKLAAKRWHSLMQQPGLPLDWRDQHRFYLQLEPSPSRRLAAAWRHLRILSGRLIEADFAYAARFGASRVWMVWMLRQFRLATSLIRRRSADEG